MIILKMQHIIPLKLYGAPSHTSPFLVPRKKKRINDNIFISSILLSGKRNKRGPLRVPEKK